MFFKDFDSWKWTIDTLMQFGSACVFFFQIGVLVTVFFRPIAVSAHLAKALAIVGTMLILAAVGLQFSLGATCGVPCPKDCVLPAPDFNHNAAFHLIMALSVILVTVEITKICRSIDEEQLKKIWANNFFIII